MKVTIRKRFRDADTQQLMLAGQKAEYDKVRALKLARSGFVQIDEVIEEDAPNFSLDEVETESPEQSISGPDEQGEEPATEEDDDEAEEPEKVEVPAPSKKEITGFPGKRGRKPKK